MQEAFLNGTTCFLHAEEWQRVIQAAVYNDPLVPRDQVGLVVKLWARLGRGPNLFKAVEDLVLSPTPVPAGKQEKMIERLIQEQEHLKEWLILGQQYQYGSTDNRWRGLREDATALLRDFPIREAPTEQRITWRVLQGTYLLCCSPQNAAAIRHESSRFPEFESTCQSLAEEIMSIANDSPDQQSERLIGGLFLSEVGGMAKAVISTREAWSEGLEQPSFGSTRNDTGMIEQWKFEEWCRAMGRKIKPKGGCDLLRS